MRIIVCIKQVPNSSLIKIDPETGALIRDGVPNIINPDDKGGIEEALRIKERIPGTTVTVICMGPPQATTALREALSLGADDGVLVTDRAFGGSDTRATAFILGSTIRSLGEFDLIICGRQAIDGDTAQVGPQLAEELNLPQITYVSKLELEGDNVTAYRNLEKTILVMNAKLPILLTAMKEMNDVRYPTVQGIRAAFNKPILIVDNKKLNLDPKNIGFEGSPTKVMKSFVPKPRQRGEMLEGATVGELVQTLFGKLQTTKALS